MKKNLIYNALYIDQNNNVKSVNSRSNSTDSYIKQSIVSLVSAKYTNPDCDVMIVTNKPLPEKFKKILKLHNIEELIVQFEKYIFPEKFKWSYAFYKLDVLSNITKKTDYKCYLGVDTDTYFSSKLSDMWEECKFNLPIILQLNPTFTDPDRAIIYNEYNKLFPENETKKPITQVGGEFIAGTKETLIELEKQTSLYYNKIKDRNFDINTTIGDEALLSMACDNIKTLPASPYIYRFWTRINYYNASFDWNKIPIWHLPSEKTFGLQIVYKKILEGKIPSMKKASKIFNLPTPPRYNFLMIKYVWHKIIERIKVFIKKQVKHSNQ